MSCSPCGSKNFLPKCAIYVVLNQLVCSLCGACGRNKTRRYDDFKRAVRYLSRRSVDPRGGYAAFLGLRENDPTKFAAIYIDNIRGEFDPNLGRHKVYHVAFVLYGDTNAVCRSLRQRNTFISANTTEVTGDSLAEGAVSQKVFYAVSNPVTPAGFNNGFLPPGVGPTIPGTPEDIVANNELGIGF
jgi:hypothetical protein